MPDDFARDQFGTTPEDLQGGESRGDKQRINYQWTREYSPATETKPHRLGSRVRRRNGDGFVVLPEAFSEHVLNRAAWREVKLRVAQLSEQDDWAQLVVGAIQWRDDTWSAEPGFPSSQVSGPASHPHVALWRVIHRIYLRAERSRTANDRGTSSGVPVWGVSVKVEAAERPFMSQRASLGKRWIGRSAGRVH